MLLGNIKNKLFIVSWYGVSNIGGLERVTQYLVKAWRDVYDIQIVDFEEIEKNFKYAKWLHKHIAIDAVITSLYVRKLKKSNPKAKVVIQGYNCPFIKADLAIAHGTMRGYQLAVGKSKKWHFSQIYERIGMKNAVKVMAVGNHVKEEVKTLYKINEKKIVVIENAVDTEIFFPIYKEKNEKRCCILYAGRIEHRKGINKLLQLAQEIEEKPDFHLLIAANGSENIDKFVRFQNTEIWSGLNNLQMNEFYNAGDVLFFPSLYEGFEMVTTECLSAGVPVIGNKVGAIGDLYERGQKGVEIIDGSGDNLLDKVKLVAQAFSDVELKEKLHDDMKRQFGLDIYISRLQSIWE